MTKEEKILAKGDIVDKHVESALQFRQSPSDYRFRVTAELIGRKAADISIEYAISVLEDVKQQCANSFYHKSAKIFEDKIEELKKLL